MTTKPPLDPRQALDLLVTIAEMAHKRAQRRAEGKQLPIEMDDGFYINVLASCGAALKVVKRSHAHAFTNIDEVLSHLQGEQA